MLAFLFGMVCGAIIQDEPKIEGKYVRNYVGEQYYVRTDQRGLTQMKVSQQELFERGKYFYLTDDYQSVGLSEEEFYKLIGQQKNLDPKKK